MAEIVLINPRFEVSYWGCEHALPLFGKRANVPTACLPLLAALTPAPHRVTLIDENVEPIDYERVARADLVGLTGMTVQRRRMREILAELRSRGVFTVVGGPWVTVHEHYFGDLADVIFIGEAEETWPRFLDEWADGRHTQRYEQSDRTDMTTVPTPRYDLLKMRHYMFGSVQFSRGCPFQCEFCDIIVTFGRRPRLKTSQQVLAELDALTAEGQEIAFVVDDNLIGNKRAIKQLLAEVIAWQQRRGYPLTFFTEASLDLAEDQELMRLMVDANIQTVFVGIESPNEASLIETKKLQNVRKGGTLVEKVRIIQDAGLDVWCGMILGFDHDDETVFDAHRNFLEQANILQAMVGMLSAIPTTPLYDRLRDEGRLDLDDEPAFGTNVIPLRLTREALRDGYLRLMQQLYEPRAYFDRLDALFIERGFRFGQTRGRYWRRHPLSGLKAQGLTMARCLGLYARLMRNVPEAELRDEYRRRIRGLLRVRRDPGVLFVYLIKCAVHYHCYTMTRNMAQQRTPIVNTM
ncbi:MAG: B12-binding domain-containing radical SAM protein [Pirellulaceae bacterium]